MKIPEDIYDRVLELVTMLVNASESGDNRSYWEHYNDLKAFCETTSEAGNDHPFLWESLADFTTDNKAAITLYLRGLQANGIDLVAFRASIKFALAERHFDLGDMQVAYRYASEANAEARTLDDLDLRRDISEFLLKVSAA